MSAPVLLAEQQGSVRLLTLNRPERRNALDADLIAALRAQAEDADADAETGVVVVGGAGPSFCAGGDFRQFLEADAVRGPVDFLAELSDCFTRIENSPKPWVAALHGHVIAGGLELALVCDVVIAARGTLVGDGHLRNGLVSAGGSGVRLERAVGRGWARWLQLSGELTTAEELLPTGWVRSVVPAPALREHAQSVAERLGSVAGPAQRRFKTLLREVRALDASAGLRREIEAFGENWAENDVPSALTAFLEGRPGTGTEDGRASPAEGGTR